uniref:Uncharacterized protein n=1 Tax=Chromera velia CCMP2878 TaxID=1169474 RepID=A0A0G4I3C9_9ALVE|eukprot:Cvel_10576.t1-p1 / transcript=Cvel_10576.t1 / gene=Cvel_10576 / organism=Chromera_velia_CCMP2878 / gene_product=Translation initiation factor IF-2, putative / transcript_product=Translation initiation factor IF-2, putative / location=Cvel_scaffold641:9130-11415(-) / protein_length=361 / sequence_SO=supercontig / SO=protein_coding / is_pseudo=false
MPKSSLELIQTAIQEKFSQVQKKINKARIEARSGEVVAFCRDALEILEVADKNARAFQDLPGFEAAHIDAVVPAILLRQFRAQSERVRQKAMGVRDAQTEVERYGNELNFLEKEIEKRMPGGLMSLMQALKHTVSHTVKQEVDSHLKGKGDGTLPSTSAPHPLPKEKSQHKESAPPGDAEKRGGSTRKKKKEDRQKKDQSQIENHKGGQKRNAPTDSLTALQERDGNAEGKQTEGRTEQQQKRFRSDGEAGRGDGNLSHIQHSSKAPVQQTHAGQGQNPHSQGPEAQGYHPQGLEVQGYYLQGPEAHEYRPQGLEVQRYRPQGPEVQGYRPQGPEVQGYRPQGPEFQGYRPQGPEVQGYRL